jgi:hypothetical protein
MISAGLDLLDLINVIKAICITTPFNKPSKKYTPNALVNKYLM